MNSKNAFYLLFVQDFGEGPLFKNQIDLVNDLVNTPESSYYCNKSKIDEYNKSVSRLKAYISQLFSEEAKRNITADFKNSLQILLVKKLSNTHYDVNEVLNEILTDLRDKNIATRHFTTQSIKRYNKHDISLFENILDAHHISIFTTREIVLEFNLLNRKQSLIDLLLEDLFLSLKENKKVKKYRFNFPLNQTCVLFWLGLEKAICSYLNNNIHSIPFLVPLITSNQPLSNFRMNINEPAMFIPKFAKELLHYTSKNHIISVFHLTAPIYIIPSIMINPNDPFDANGYLFLQSQTREDEVHKLTSQELVLWRLFVWEKLKIHKLGKLVEYTDQLTS